MTASKPCVYFENEVRFGLYTEPRTSERRAACRGIKLDPRMLGMCVTVQAMQSVVKPVFHSSLEVGEGHES